MDYTSKPKNFNPKFEVVSCFLQNKGEFVLLHRQNHKPEGGTWGMPAGKIDPEEDIYEAVLREVFEETGCKLEKEQLKYFKKLYVRYPEYDFIYHIFYSNLAKRSMITINREEHMDYKWITPKDALKLNMIEGLDQCIKLFYFQN